jgi:predicted RecB family nuclease
MIIKKGTKYYLVDRELTKSEVDEHKSKLQSHYDTIDQRTAAQVKEIQDKAAESKVKTKAELDDIDAL